MGTSVSPCRRVLPHKLRQGPRDLILPRERQHLAHLLAREVAQDGASCARRAAGQQLGKRRLLLRPATHCYKHHEVAFESRDEVGNCVEGHSDPFIPVRTYLLAVERQLAQ